MFSDDLADRTLPPTERHRREARNRGEVARSAELTAALILLTASGVLWFLAPACIKMLVVFMRSTLTAPVPPSLTIASTGELAQRVVWGLGATLWPIVLVLFVGGMAASWIQTGWLWLPTAIVPRFRQSPLISCGRVGVALGRLLQLAVLALVTWRFLLTSGLQLRSVGLDEPMAMLVRPARMLGELCLQLSLSLVLFALVDYGVRFWRHEQRLKMTVEERRREQKDDGPNPSIKQRRARGVEHAAPPLSLAEIDAIDATSP